MKTNQKGCNTDLVPRGVRTPIYRKYVYPRENLLNVNVVCGGRIGDEEQLESNNNLAIKQ